MRSQSLRRLYLFYFLINMSANMVHPITPTLFKSLGYADYMFGLAFSCMAITNGIISPFWGALSDRWGNIRVYSMGLVGYASGQTLFMLSTHQALTLAARLFTGIFSGTQVICAMAYVAQVSDSGQRGKNMAYLAAFGALGISAGYFFGGLVGVVSLRLTFLMQISLCLCLAGALHLFMQRPGPASQDASTLKSSTRFPALFR